MINRPSADMAIIPADALTYLGRYEESIAVYDKILTQKPQSPNALGRKGLTLYDTGMLEEAVPLF